MLNTLNVNLNTDLKVTRVPELGIKIKSQDINNNLFVLRFTDKGNAIVLDETYTVEILTKFEKSKSHRLTSATVYRDYARWEFDTSFITQDEKVVNYVYVRKAGSLVVSADANAFAFDVGLSEIDKDAGRVAEVYDENYQKYLDEFAQAEQARKEAEILRQESYDAKVDTAIVEADVVGKVDNKVTELTPRMNELTAQLAQTAAGIPLSEIKEINSVTGFTIVPLNYFDGYLWATRNSEIVKSNDDGATWIVVSNRPEAIHTILPTSDGQLLAVSTSSVYKSSGLGGTVTWVKKVTISHPGGSGIVPFGVDGSGKNFIISEYSGANLAESRYVWISIDGGNTFNVVLDKLIIDPSNQSHWHGVCYDKWEDRFFASLAHGGVDGIFYSDDNGANWDKIGGDFQPLAPATTLKATYNGIVLGSDSEVGGLYGIARTQKPENMVMKFIARWDVKMSIGIQGFAMRSTLDETTGQVYVAFKSSTNEASATIMAGTATTGSQIWKSEDNMPTEFSHIAVTDKMIHGIIQTGGVNRLVTALKPSPGVESIDGGNIKTGVSYDNTSIAIGQGTLTKSPYEVLIGREASITNTASRGVTIGFKAKGTGYAVTIGAESETLSSGQRAVAIGYKSKSSNDAISIGPESEAIGNSVSIGNNSKALGGRGVTIGDLATASGNLAIALGAGSSAKNDSISIGQGSKQAEAQSGFGISIGRFTETGTYAVAIGDQAKSISPNSVALGSNTHTTVSYQVAIGNRQLEMTKLANTPAAPSAGNVRVFARETAGVLELCAMLGTKVTVLATA